MTMPESDRENFRKMTIEAVDFIDELQNASPEAIKTCKKFVMDCWDSDEPPTDDYYRGVIAGIDIGATTMPGHAHIMRCYALYQLETRGDQSPSSSMPPDSPGGL